MGEKFKITLNKLNEIIEQQAKRITKLVYKNKTLKKRAEAAEEDWQITEEMREQLKNKNKAQAERIKELEEENKAQKEVIKIDVRIFEAIRNEYPNSKDLQAKITHREEQVEQALKAPAASERSK